MDPLQTLFADLHSPDPAIRFSVLSRIEDLQWDDQQIARLRELANQEKDAGTRFHINKILARIERERGQNHTSPPTAEQVEELLKNPNRDDLSLALMLEELPPADAQLVAIALRDIDWTTFSAPLLPFILRFLKRHGSPQDVPRIESLCRHPDPRVLSEAVEALEKLNPERLKDLIVPLLVSPIHGIRSRAVRILYRWDPKEALLHFESMLFSDEPEDRQAALFHAFFFPFNEIEPLMLKFLAIENDVVMLERAGLLFRANPDPQEPLRLLEVRESCIGTKKRVIGEILTGVIDSLFQAGLVKKQPAQLLAELEKEFFRRRVNQLIDACRLSLQSDDAHERLQAALRLAELFHRGFEETRQILETWLQKEQDIKVREKILLRLGPILAAKFQQTPSDTVVSPEAGPQASPTDTFFETETTPHPIRPSEIDLTKAPPAQRLRILANLNRSGLLRVRSCLPTLLRNGSTEEKLLVLQALDRTGEKDDASLALLCISDNDPNVVCMAIEVLGNLDSDLLSPHLPRLIQHTSDEVRAAALKVFALFDKKQALSLVEKMLFSLQPKQRTLAISCLAQFDFPSVRDLLLRAIEKEQIPENVRQICSIMSAHIDEELFFALYSAADSAPETTRELLKNFRKEAAAILIQQKLTRFSNLQELLSEAQRRSEDEARRKQAQSPAYSLKNIQKMRQQQLADQSPKIDASLVRFAIAAYGIGAVLTALIWFLFLAPPPPTPDASPQNISETNKPATPSFDRSVRNIDGHVIEANETTQTIRVAIPDNTKEIFLIDFHDTGLKMPSIGSRFRGQIKPISREGNIIKCEVLAIY